MSCFVLVHGTGCGGWVWQRFSRLLRAKGHEVYSPTLTGLADRRHLLNQGVNLTTHITDITNLIFYEDLSQVILVGNSYAGMVITGVAATIPERLKLLVYLDAYLPDDGQSEADLLPKGTWAARLAEAAENAGVVQPPPPGIFGISDPALAGWVSERTTPHPISTYTEPVHTGVNASQPLPLVYIHCTGNPPSTPDLFASSAEKARRKGWPVIELNAGHLAMLSHPHLLAETILSALESDI